MPTILIWIITLQNDQIFQAPLPDFLLLFATKILSFSFSVVQDVAFRVKLTPLTAYFEIKISGYNCMIELKQKPRKKWDLIHQFIVAIKRWDSYPRYYYLFPWVLLMEIISGIVLVFNWILYIYIILILNEWRNNYTLPLFSQCM